MGKYTELDDMVFSVFGSDDWASTGVKVVPSNFLAKGHEEFVRINIIPGDRGINHQSVSGILIANIFVESGNGPSRTSEVADLLDRFLSGVRLSNEATKGLQFFGSSLVSLGVDPKISSLFRADYTINFKYYRGQ
jgi:hypothetical protein